MPELTSPAVVKELMAKHNLSFHKGLGQNFLIDADVLEDIVRFSGIDQETGVIEIGPGIGVLTRELSHHAAKVVSIELDDRLFPLLSETLAGCENVEVIHQDALKVDYEKLISEEFPGMPVRLAANLPYYITTPILMKLLEARLPLESITVLVQKEVAERMAAAPGGKTYGALSVAVQYYTEPERVLTVPPHCFMPPPKVHSEVIRLKIRKEPAVTVKDEAQFFKVVRAAFGQRRKTLINALSNSGMFQMSREALRTLFETLGLQEDIRGERLSLVQFAQLSDGIF